MISIDFSGRRLHAPYMKLLIAVAVALVAGVVGWRIATLPVFTVLAIAATVMLLFSSRPIFGLFVSFPLLFLFPSQVIDIEFPLFSSPLQIVVVSTAAIALARTLAQKKSLPPSSLYLPLLMCLAVLCTNWAAGHGPDAGLRVYRFVLGLAWLLMTLLLVETPRQARNLLIAVIGTTWIMAVLWLLLTVKFSLSNAPLSAYFSLAGAAWSPDFASSDPSGGLIRIGSAYDFMVIVMVLPLFVSLAFWGSPRRVRRFSWLGMMACVSLIATGGFLISATAMLIGTAAVMLLGLRYHLLGRSNLVQILTVLALLVGLLLLTRSGQKVLTKAREIPAGQSSSLRDVRVRFMIYQTGIALFREYPLFGTGGYFRGGSVVGGIPVLGHSTLIESAYQFGLIYLIPLTMLIVNIGAGYRHILRQPLRPNERVLVIGLASSFLVWLSLCAVNPVLGEPGPDSVFWTFVGLTIIWNKWLKTREDAQWVA